jgi:hypothetical protein
MFKRFMSVTLFSMSILIISPCAMAQDISITPELDRLEEATGLKLRPDYPDPDQTNVPLFKWDPKKQFWPSLAAATICTAIVLVALHASSGGHVDTSEQMPVKH